MYLKKSKSYAITQKLPYKDKHRHNQRSQQDNLQKSQIQKNQTQKSPQVEVESFSGEYHMYHFIPLQT